MKNISVSIALTISFIAYSLAQDLPSSGGTLTGIIKAKGVRDSRDVVVYLENVKAEFPAPKEKPLVDQKDLVFIPHVLPVLAGTTVKFGNSDNVRHNVFSPSKAKKFNLGTYGAGIVREVTLDKPGVVTVLCNVHQEMSSFIVVLENPFFAKTAPNGKYTIQNIPPGTYKLKTWHEKLKKYNQEVTISEGKITSLEISLSR
jgi:plastocyanin